jgi:phosphoesterase RecJ-like protein
MSELQDVVAALNTSSSILISVHRNPDGDAIGSQLALMLALEKQGKTVTAHNLDPVPHIYEFLPSSGRITHGQVPAQQFDAFVVLDSEPDRTGLFNGSWPAATLINIDHHLTNPRQWPLTWLVPDATATGELVYRLIEALGVPLDESIALCLYTCIFTDTGSFRYSNTTPESMRMAAKLIDAGANPWLVTEHVYESFAFRRIKLLGHVLSGMERSKDGRIAWVLVSDDLYRATGTTAEDTDNFVNFVRSVKGVEVAVLFRQTGPERYKISLRSKGRVDLSKVAKTLGGGGHRNAAGGVVDGPFSVVRDRVLSGVNQELLVQLGKGSVREI